MFSLSRPTKYHLQIEELEGRLLLSGEPHLVADINQQPADWDFTEHDGLVYFPAHDPTLGREVLWKTDATPEGTSAIKDLGSNPEVFASVGDLLFIGTDSGELWKSDGTSDGTTLLRRFDQSFLRATMADVGASLFFTWAQEFGTEGELWTSDGTPEGTKSLKTFYRIGALHAFNDRLFFSADDDDFETELWTSDGTVDGTFQLKDIWDGDRGSTPQYFTNVGEVFYFSARTDQGTELWRSDGTDEGTTLLKDIRNLAGGSYPQYLTAAGGDLFFTADDGEFGRELWISDGTESGTRRVHDLLPGADGSTPQQLAAVNDTVFFSADNGLAGRELWKSDGTERGTVQVKDIRPGPDGSNPNHLIHVDGTLFFTADDGQSGRELWKSDGTESGTVRVRDIRLGSKGSQGADGGLFGPIITRRPAQTNGKLVFGANDGTNGAGLWSSDGTEQGTLALNVRHPTGDASISQFELQATSKRLFFAARDGEQGFARAVWTTDGTEEGTKRLSEPQGCPFLYPADDQLFFVDGRELSQLWRTDGTIEGTVLVKDGPFGDPGLCDFSGIYSLSNIDGQLFFTGYNDGTGYEPWTSDGTAEGTRLLKDIRPGDRSSGIDATENAWMSLANEVYFVADDGSSGRELWRTDGTSDGTTMLVDLNPGPDGSDPTLLTVWDGAILFVADDGMSGREMWRTDGTPEGTYLLKDILPGAAGGYPPEFGEFGRAWWTNMSDQVLFIADDGVNGRELWRTNGTADGTYLVKDIRPGEEGSNPARWTVIGDQLFFTADDGSHGTELWKTDGTPDGTFMLQDIRKGPQGADLDLWRLAMGNRLFFSPDDGIHGREIWTSDGTPEGTVLLKDVWPGSESSQPDTPGYPSERWAVDTGGLLYFAATDPAHGRELWKTDGSPEGTQLVKDIFVGADGSDPLRGTVVDGQLYFRSNDGVTGIELWTTDGTTMGTVQVADIREGAPGSDPRPLAEFNGDLYFTANDGIHGHELWVLPLRSEPDPLPGDANQDGEVEFADFLILAENFGRTDDVSFLDGDFDGDGEVQFNDFVILAENFGRTNQPPTRPASPPPLLPAAVDVAISSGYHEE